MGKTENLHTEEKDKIAAKTWKLLMTEMFALENVYMVEIPCYLLKKLFREDSLNLFMKHLRKAKRSPVLKWSADDNLATYYSSHASI